MVGEAMSRRFAAQRLAGYGRAGWGRRFAPSEAVEQRCRTTRLATFDAARGPWEQHAAEQDNFFITYEFARAWWQVYGRGGELFLHQVFDERGQSIGILPLYVSTIRFGRFARFIGHGPADQLGPVCGAESRPAVAAALRDLIDGAGQPSTLLAERMRADEGWQEMLHGRHIRRESFSLIDLRELDWEGWLETKSANFRQQTRKAERRLARDHRLEYRLVTDEAEVLPALETLIRLHDARWRGASAAFDPKRRAFHERFAMAAARRGWLRVLLATIDGEPAAAWLGYRYGGAESSYLMGWAPEWAPHNVGSVLRMHAIREATGHVDEFRLLLGNEPHKQRLATADPGLDTFLVGDAMLPRVAHALIEQRHRTPAVMRRLVASRLGW
ncbi:MAG: hypothetical protein AVDCRST_MAG38-767 [uncultured Solirubrobacteraceae bacterium]|uniref:BioF2-like acetyltransferase domain-containing protein n=1 Tax=uncultured Solirubrobacteraceae bacterium TaxID=1162706 RepID=A0A6J4R9K1_9ACTN|nr:MAG: hypothetical protein AVDCRST_MAG38-767 [uncultured Solirubrobacteraceae bacterium]